MGKAQQSTTPGYNYCCCAARGWALGQGPGLADDEVHVGATLNTIAAFPRTFPRSTNFLTPGRNRRIRLEVRTEAMIGFHCRQFVRARSLKITDQTTWTFNPWADCQLLVRNAGQWSRGRQKSDPWMQQAAPGVNGEACLVGEGGWSLGRVVGFEIPKVRAWL